MKRIYLAAPYSHIDTSICEERLEKINALCAELIMEGHVILSPLTHYVPLVEYLPLEKLDWEFWKIQDFSHLESCDTILVYMLEGWEESEGVQEEIVYARKLGKNIVYWEEKLLDKTKENDVDKR